MIQNAIPIIIGWVTMSVLYGASVALIVRRWRQDISKYKREINELKELIGEPGDYSPAFPENSTDFPQFPPDSPDNEENDYEQ